MLINKRIYRQFINQMNLESLLRQKEELTGQLGNKKKLQEIFFQERDFHQLEQFKLQLIDQLIAITKKGYRSKIFESFVEKYKQNMTSLATFTTDLIQFVQQFQALSLVHRHHTSQSLLLALLLSKIQNKKVVLVLDYSQLSRNCQMFEREGELDMVSFVQSCLSQQNIQFVDLSLKYVQRTQINNNSIVILDLFSLELPKYFLTVVQNYKKLRSAANLVLYYSEQQLSEIEYLIQQIQKKNGHFEGIRLELNPHHPVQTFQCENYSQMFAKIFAFIQNISKYAEKQDIIIYYPLDEPLYKFIRRFKEQTLKASSKDTYNLITTSNQELSKQKVNIFLVKNEQQLRRWRYDYSKVFMIQDFGYQSLFLFDYDIGCFMERYTFVTLREMNKRMLWIGSDRPGVYYYLTEQTIPSSNFLDSYSQISSLIVMAIHYGHLQLIDLNHQRVKKCIKYLLDLGIIQTDDATKNSYKIEDKRYVKYIQQNISPLETNLMLKVLDDQKLLDKNKQKYLNLMAMTISVMNNEGSLRKLKQEMQGSHIKPYAVWRKSGYIQSCLQILTKCELIQSRKHNSPSQEFRRKTSRTLQGKHELYQKNKVKRKKNFEEMDVNDLISDYTVNQDLLHILRDRVQQLRFAFQFQMLPILIDKECVNRVMQFFLAATVKSNIGIYTGSKNSQYYNGRENIFLSQNCLFYILNQRPQLVAIVRMTEIQGKKVINMGNSVHKDAYLQIFGNMPVFQRMFSSKPELNLQGKQQIIKQALQVSKEFKYQNICSAVLQLLVKDNGKLVQQFEQQNNCHLSLQMQLGTIIIKCFKDDIENKNYIKENIDILLKKLNQHCKNYSKKLHYMGKLNFILNQGGKILDITDSDQTSRCILKNLPLEIAKDYVKIILEGHTLKSLEVIDPTGYNAKPSAIIEFYSKKAFQNFMQDYRRNMQRQNYIQLQPIKDSQYDQLKKQQEKNQVLGNGRSMLVFKWYTWKSLGKAQVKFKNEEGLKTAITILENRPLFDDSKVKFYADASNKLILNIQNLNQKTDQIFIAQALGTEDDIESVQILKTPLKQTLGDSQHIGHLIKIGANKKDIVPHKILSIQKKKLGLKVAKVALSQNHLLNQIAENLNKQTNVFGEGRIYVQPLFERQTLIPEGCLEIYTQLYEDLLKSLEKEKPKIKYEIREDEQNIYMVLMSSIQQTLLYILARFKEKLGGVKIDFPYSAKNIILNEIGVANFLDMEEKYECKFLISVYSSKIRVLAKQEYIKAIQKQVQDRINNHFFYKVPLTSKNYKYYQNNLQALAQIQKKFELHLVQLQQDNFAILLEGDVLMIKEASQFIYAKAKTQTKTNQVQAGQVCGICCEKIEESYLLVCQHRFCKECLVDYLRYSLGDMSMFPLKCPDNTCRKQVNCIDLENLFEFVDWYKMRTITANEFLKTNEDYSYCLTPGCQQINKLQKSNMDGIFSEFMRCDICKSTFCLECNAAYHPGRTCDQAKVSQDELMKKFVAEQGVRKCPGKKCKALVTRYTGCFKVQCSRCNTCMCFKCPADNMAYYNNPTQCYEHLNAAHGGYY